MTDSQSTSSNAAAGSAVHTAVGALLRQSREGAGLNVADAARALRISQKYLEALEDGRHADLPGTAYAIGFVRSYAEHLHLDSEEIVRRYKDEAAGVGTKNDLVFPKPIADGGVPGGAVLGLGVMVAAVAYGVWYWNSNNTEVEIARVEAVPEHIAVAGQSADASTSAEPTTEPIASPEPVADAAEDRTPDVSSPDGDKPAEDTPLETAAVDETPVDVVVSAQAPVVQTPVVEAPVVDEAMAQEATEAAPQVAEGAEQASKPEPQPTPEPAAVEAVEAEAEEVVASIAAEQPAVETAPQAAESAVEETVTSSVETASVPPTTAVERQNDGPSRITVRAKSNSWIQIRDEIADRLLFTRLLREGQEYQVPNRDGLRLMTGNAGALELLVDGTAVPAIGDVGEVRRNVELDVDKLQSGSAVSE